MKVLPYMLVQRECENQRKKSRAKASAFKCSHNVREPNASQGVPSVTVLA